MGRKAKEIVKANVQEVISDLNKAYADEWLAHYQYWLNAQWIRGMDASGFGGILNYCFGSCYSMLSVRYYFPFIMRA